MNDRSGNGKPALGASAGGAEDANGTDGLPCGVYPAQYAVAALYTNARDRGLTALRVLTRSVFSVVFSKV